MFGSLARKVFGTTNSRKIKGYQRAVDRINALEPEIQALSDTELTAQTSKFRERLEAGESLDSLLPEAFATVREAALRTLGMRHFDVQLVGGMVLHDGRIAEMKTGEGKTLVATLAVYLNALAGKGVHVVTVNDYLATRDAEWMGQIYRFLGMTVGCITHELNDPERRAAYSADITYGTNNEYGFDYLRDNMRYSLDEMVQRKHHFAIVDEVDSILIDEARTPLIISGPTEDNSELYIQLDAYIPLLSEEHYEKDEKSKQVTFTEEGTEFLEAELKKNKVINEDSNLYDLENVSYVHHLTQALRAHKLFARDVDYLVKDQKVVIVDEFTGRMMEGRRFSEGLHQALEAKENVPIQNENQTLASVTFQNYFRLYGKLAGMTGTAMTEANEFGDIYSLEVVEIPTHVDVARVDHDDEVYRTAQEKYDAIVKLVEECYKKQQPILVGTVSIEKSEYIASLLKKKKIKHNVLNARYHETEAHIIAQAGRLGAVTIATNMAGRGTDIMLGGNPDLQIIDELGEDKLDSPEAKKIRERVAKDKKAVLEAGGLYVVGTERHESRRIDNQLRGRSGRQGDPGASKFFLSLEDDLMRIFGSERIDALLQKLGLKEGEAIFHPWMNKALERAQQKVEARNYDIRKNLLKFDNVMNDQRTVIFDQRIELMQEEDVSDTILEMSDDLVQEFVARHIPLKSYPEQWDVEGLASEMEVTFGIESPIAEWAKEEGIAESEIRDRLMQATHALWAHKREENGEEPLKLAQKRILLLTLDRLWKDHLLSLDHLRQGIGLRAYAQRDPLNEYKQEAFGLFEQMLDNLRIEVVRWLAHLKITVHNRDEETDDPLVKRFREQRMKETREDPALMGGMANPTFVQNGIEDNVTPLHNHVNPEDRDPADPSTWGKVGRNEVCPCGSGKKYKHCHGTL